MTKRVNARDLHRFAVADLLGSDNAGTIAPNTFARREDDGSIVVTLHSTDIVRDHGNGIFTLNTGGWNTTTTRQRMNAVLPENVKVRSIKSKPHVVIQGSRGEVVWPLADGDTIDATI